MTVELIRETIREHARLPVSLDALPDDASLYEAGMTSHASIGLMLGLEERFGIEFPDQMLRRSVFESVNSIHMALRQVAGGDEGSM